MHAASVIKKDSSCSLKGMKVLIVEDKVINLSVLFKALDTLGLDISIAPDGNTALKLIDNLKPDIILLDIILPSIDGFEVCAKIKSNEATKDIPVIFITGKTDQEDIMRGFEVGGVDYITKPFNPQETLARIQTHLRLQVAKNEIVVSADKLKQSNKELEDFCSIASHDLKEPLRKIISFGDHLWQESRDSLGDKEKIYLSKMEAAILRMEKFIDDLLEYSRVTATTKKDEPVDLNLIVKLVLDDLDTRLKQVNGTVNVQSLPTVEANPLQLNQLFLNLISNSLKFVKEGVPPVINIQSLPTEDESFKIVVQDNGIGIKSDYFDRIFKPFERLNGRSAFEGSGMGLAICKKIVNRYKGTLQVESELGHGTRFVIIWPQPKAS